MKFEHPSGIEVFQWPEFIAFANRMGIDIRKETHTREVVICIPYDGVCMIEQTYLGQDKKPKPTGL